MKALAALIPALALAQGAAIPKREARPSPLVRPGVAVPRVHFEDIAVQAGLGFRHVSGDPVNKQYLVESTGSGVALFDFDNDGLLDIFFVNGANWRGSRQTSALFRNLGGLRFENVTAKAGIGKIGWGQGVCAGDYDGDGFQDLFITYWGKNTLYRNERNGTFRDVSAAAGLLTPEDRWSTGCAFFDYDRDGKLDLAIANYARLDPAITPKPGANPLCMYKGLPVMCGPRGLPGGSNLLYRNMGAGKFEDVSAESGFTKPAGYYGFSVLTGDFDNDGWTDVYVANDSTPSLLYRNNHDGRFADIGVRSGAAFNDDGEEQAGMGAAAADYDRNGTLDIAKTNFAGDTPTLYSNDGKAFFTDLTIRAGLAVSTRFLGWGIGFLDFDHDGWKDIFIANGHVYPQVDKLHDQSPYRQERNLYWNLGNGAFADISGKAGPGIVARHSSRGVAFGDLDNDGSIEIVIANIDSTPSLLVNRGPKMNWLIVDLNNAFGARVQVNGQTGEVQSGGSYLSHSDSRLHFGLGEAARHDEIVVRWPNGRTGQFPGGAANRIVRLTPQ